MKSEATTRQAEKHTHSCRNCGNGVDCTGNGEGCFEGYCDECIGEDLDKFYKEQEVAIECKCDGCGEWCTLCSLPGESCECMDPEIVDCEACSGDGLTGEQE